MVHDHPMRAILQVGEGSGWATLVAGLAVSLGALGRLFGAITTDGVNQWIILIFGAVVGAVGVGTVAYHRIQRALLDGQTMAAINAANVAAIAANKPPPYPAFMPKGWEHIKG